MVAVLPQDGAAASPRHLIPHTFWKRFRYSRGEFLVRGRILREF
jgi:hypothetical protein